MNILYVGVFDNTKASTNTSQLLCLSRLGHNVVGYNYRKKSELIGNKARDQDIIDLVNNRNFDLVIYSKCNEVSERVFIENSKKTKTCLWFMDPLVSYNQEMKLKTGIVDYFCCDKENVLKLALQINKNSFHVFEGFDSDIDKPQNLDKLINVSFIGNIYGQRQKYIDSIKHPVSVINSAYGANHAIEVSKSTINLNFCTAHGASDRVYKIMAAGGFLMSDEWTGRKKYFKDGKDLVIFTSIEDLNKKIDYYLENEKERQSIAENGYKKVQQFSRINWAKSIINLYETTT